MPYIKGTRRADDPFVRIADTDDLPEGSPVLVTAARFLADPAAFAQRPRNAPVGVIWPNHRDVAELAPYLDQLALVALIFPVFRDGRAYSQARLLRERLRYGGELRAIGDVLRDQFLFLVRAGFDAFEVKKESDAASFEAALQRYSVVYQPAADGRATAFQQRMGAPVRLRRDDALPREAAS